MTPRRKDVNIDAELVKGLLAEQNDFLRPLVQAVVQEVLEAEMTEALGAEKSERTGQRVLRSEAGDAGGNARTAGATGPAGTVQHGGV